MERRSVLGLLAAGPFVLGQQIQPTQPEDYVCPMDPDVRAAKPGACPRCGMRLVLGIPDNSEYALDLKITPRLFKPGQKVQLAFRVRDPKTGHPVQKFEIMHERLFHMFIVSQDLSYFVHDHPEIGNDGIFRYEAVFPKTGMFRILGDFYPNGGTPQLIAKTVIVPGEPLALGVPRLKPDLGPSECGNLQVELVTEPAQPISGMKTLMFFKLKPGDGLEKYLGAWGHMLAASDDLIDMIHTHPFIADGGPQEQFNVIFPRARSYRIWVQFQRKGVVNTARFDLPVFELK
jgi:hypothetical protein